MSAIYIINLENFEALYKLPANASNELINAACTKAVGSPFAGKLEDLKGTELVDLYNYHADKPVNKFATKATAIERVERALENIPPFTGTVPAPKKAKKAKGKKAEGKKPQAEKKKRSKSAQMLDLLQSKGEISLSDMASRLFTSEASVRCYVSYFRNGLKGHDQVPMYIANGNINLGEKPAKEAA